MSATGHLEEGKLLDLAYGELSGPEASRAEAHLSACSVCTAALGDIRAVRRAVAPLKEEQVPTEGLESLLAYAEQATRGGGTAVATRRPRWFRWLAPATAGAALCLALVVSVQVSRYGGEGKGRSTPAEAPVMIGAAREEAPPAAMAAPEDVISAEGPLSPGAARMASKEGEALERSSGAARASPQAEVSPPAELEKAAPSRKLAQAPRGEMKRKADAAPLGGLAGAFSADARSSPGAAGIGAPMAPAPGRREADREELASEASSATGGGLRARPSVAKDAAAPVAEGKGSAAVSALLEQARHAAAARAWRTAGELGVKALLAGASGPQRTEALRHACRGFGQADPARAKTYCEQLALEPSSPTK